MAAAAAAGGAPAESDEEPFFPDYVLVGELEWAAEFVFVEPDATAVAKASPQPAPGGKGKGPGPPPAKGKGKGPGAPPPVKGKGPPPPSGGKGPPSAPVPAPFGKRLHWTSLPEEKLRDTIFEELSAVDKPELDFKVLEQMFRPEKEKEKGKGGKPPAKAPAAPERDRKVQFLDDKRAQNIVIVLRKVCNKSSASELAARLRALDLDTPLPADACELLLQLLPHLLGSGLEQYQGPVDRLRELERDLLDLVRVPRLQPRLSVFLLSSQLDATRAEAAAEVAALARACHQVKTSALLRRLLQYVLALGNYLNRGSGGGEESWEVRGITLESLLRLRHFRAGGDLTALHGVAHHLARDISNFPQKLRGELEDVQKIGPGALQAVRDRLAALEAHGHELDNELSMKDAYEVDGDRRAVESLTRLAERTQGIIDDLRLQFETALTEAHSLLEFFGVAQRDAGRSGPRGDASVEQFFGSLVEIASHIQACSADLESRAVRFRKDDRAPSQKSSPREARERLSKADPERGREKLAAVLRARALACAERESS